MDVGKMIHDRRVELGYSLEDVGKAVGVGKSTVRKWETGFISNMRRDRLAALSEFLGLSPISFVTGEREISIHKEDAALQELIDLCNSRPGLAGQILALLQVQSQSDRDDSSNRR